MNNTYTVSIFVAAPGTPFRGGGSSAAGHVYYEIADGSTKLSYGFAPESSGVMSGPGAVSDKDAGRYLDPLYVRSLEITQDQYEKLKAFGDDPEKHRFSTQYNGATNSCIDFAWGALNHAGLHRTTPDQVEDKDFDGALKPLDNIKHIKSIVPPFPESKLNEEVDNPMPKQTRLQRFISDADLPAQERQMLQVIRAEVGVIDRQHGRAFDDISERISVGLLAAAKSQGLHRVDHVMLGQQPADGSGQRMFAVQGALEDPAHLRASAPVGAMARTPLEQSYDTLSQLHENAQRRVLGGVDAPQQAADASRRMV
ncbi:XVIPCD domain-containing protein [Stenotrophomonas oahuensis]|uniref:X-Tfes XVIPCD domain-containing protein n=1 Tax=Stenotrophomonas oahuensis TaxID=3003271 RepID=A0ABY9YV22_9GAMM|nr:XVIPCD domain-containing protein [Stenotrophomonas sp. A5586]WNH54023.1 hypothetical protein PDM29_07020 [Stenotrophomonas sp. A5586]